MAGPLDPETQVEDAGGPLRGFSVFTAGDGWEPTPEPPADPGGPPGAPGPPNPGISGSGLRDPLDITASFNVGATPDAGFASFTAGRGWTPSVPTFTCTEPAGQGLVRSFLEVGGIEVSNAARTLAYIQLGLAGDQWSANGGCACSVLYREAAGDRWRGEWSNLLVYAPGDVVVWGDAGPSGGYFVFLAGSSSEGAPSSTEPGTDPLAWRPLFTSPSVDAAPWYDPNRPESADFMGLLLPDTRPLSDDTTSRTATARGTGLGGSAISPPHRDALVWQLSGTLVASSYAGIEYGKRWLAAVLSDPPTDCDPCGLSDARIRTYCPPCDASHDDWGEYLLYEVALTSGVKAATQNAQAHDFLDVTFELTAGNGWLYRRPVALAAGPLLDRDPWQTCDVCTIINGIPPAISASVSTPSVIGVVGLIVQVYGGPYGASNVSIAIYPPGGGAAAGELLIGSVPPNSQFVMDSARQEMTLIDAAGEAHDGAPYVSMTEETSIPWLELSSCEPGSLVAVGVASYCSTTLEATAYISVQERDA